MSIGSKKPYSQIVIFFILGVSFLGGLLSLEEFPISHYPMYARSFDPQVYRSLRLVGESHEGDLVPINYRRVLWPFTKSSFVEAIGLHYRRSGAEKTKIILRDLLGLVNQRVQERGYKGFKSFVLYRDLYNWNDFKIQMLDRKTNISLLPVPGESVEILRVTVD